jgi:alkylation response protein AidB-like acyl-CoA dehydrogenase
MRWLGQARRAHDVATAYARKRQAFGKPLGEHEGVGFMLADNEMDLHTARLHIWHTRGCSTRASAATSNRAVPRCVLGSEWRVVDRCVQILGGQGVTARDPGDAHLRRHARLPHLRRPERSASLEHGAQAGAHGEQGRGRRPMSIANGFRLERHQLVRTP